ncbi:MAG: hypothetical protein AABX01_01115 [Candidatus Micrarchaeota archaeon]
MDERILRFFEQQRIKEDRTLGFDLDHYHEERNLGGVMLHGRFNTIVPGWGPRTEIEGLSNWVKINHHIAIPFKLGRWRIGKSPAQKIFDALFSDPNFEPARMGHSGNYEPIRDVGEIKAIKKAAPRQIKDAPPGQPVEFDLLYFAKRNQEATHRILVEIVPKSKEDALGKGMGWVRLRIVRPMPIEPRIKTMSGGIIGSRSSFPIADYVNGNQHNIESERQTISRIISHVKEALKKHGIPTENVWEKEVHYFGNKEEAYT